MLLLSWFFSVNDILSVKKEVVSQSVPPMSHMCSVVLFLESKAGQYIDTFIISTAWDSGNSDEGSQRYDCNIHSRL